jgi:hypothetical protein
MDDYDKYIDSLLAKLRETAEEIVESNKELNETLGRLSEWKEELAI